jgi:hypothetical protein
MDEKYNRSLSKVLKTLSGVRQTLPNDEQAILDSLLLRSVSFDTEGHIATASKYAGSADASKYAMEQDTGANIMSNASQVPTKFSITQDTEGHIATAGSASATIVFDEALWMYKLQN